MPARPIRPSSSYIDAQLALESGADGFLSRLRHCAGVAGAALLDQSGTPLATDGQTLTLPSKAVPLGTTGMVWPQGLRKTDGLLLVVPVPPMQEGRALWLVVWDRKGWRPRDANLLLARVVELVSHVILARVRDADARRASMFDRAASTAHLGAWSCSLPDGRIVWTNGVYDLFGLPRGSAITREQTLAMYEPESLARMEALRQHAIDTLGEFSTDVLITTGIGEPRWIRITATVDGENGKATRIFGMKRDVTDELRMSERLRELAETDALTGLASRSLFQQRMDGLGGADGAAAIGALLLVDLDNFKSINDGLGHAAGDACLVEAARRLRHCSPASALVSRIGGDEFAILIDRRSGIDPELLCARVVEALAMPFTLGGEDRMVSASVGLAHYQHGGSDTLYRNADTALYAAKSAGRNTWRLYEAA
jgi:diguanylate cyclase (GGDEF)-like protein